jgi:hypothetical protein
MITINLMTKRLRAYLSTRRWQRAHPEAMSAAKRKWEAAHPANPEQIAFRDALRRCTNPNVDNYKDYGGRGIKFLFTSFEQFFAEIGPRPEGMTLDRIDNDGNYEPGNVRWATRSQQRQNQRLAA